MGSISIREYIRWLPEEASEPTSTLVLTSPGRRFVDIRVLKKSIDDSAAASEEVPHYNPVGDVLDWAIGGTSSSTPLYPPGSAGGDGHGSPQGATHSVWRHFVDSHCASIRSEDEVCDEGDMYPLGSGDGGDRTLEKGRMVNPATGVEMDYEELWRDPEVLGPGPRDGRPGRLCVVMQLQQDGEEEGGGKGGESSFSRGMIVRLGQFCQGVLRQGGGGGGGESSFTAERWEWTGGQDELQGWKRSVRIGDGVMPCLVAMERAEDLEEGQEVREGDMVWKVVEVN